MGCFGTHAFLVDTGRLRLALSLNIWFSGVGRIDELSNWQARSLRKCNFRRNSCGKKTNCAAAVADERSRIAGDLHDSVTQTLFSTAAIADALPEVWDRHPEEARRGLDDLKLLTKGALAEMRTLLLELRPAALLEKTLGELLQQLAGAAAGRTRMPVDVEIDGDGRLPDEVQVTLYRVAQEALHNVVKARTSHGCKDASRRVTNKTSC